MKLSPWMWKAMQILAQGESTCTLVGAALTGRRSAYGHQTSAREGGRTLRALERRGLVFQSHRPDEADPRTFWMLTPKGVFEVSYAKLMRDSAL
jgi:hypothetical protein